MSIKTETEAFEVAATRLAEVVAEHHGFDLRNLSLAEARRLQGHLEAVKPGRYECLAGWPAQLVWAARTRLLRELEARVPGLRDTR